MSRWTRSKPRLPGFSPIHLYQFDPVQTTKTMVHGGHQHAGPGQATAGPGCMQASTQRGVWQRRRFSPQPESYWGNVNPLEVRELVTTRANVALKRCFFDYHRQHRHAIKVMRFSTRMVPRMHPNDGRVVSAISSCRR